MRLNALSNLSFLNFQFRLQSSIFIDKNPTDSASQLHKNEPKQKIRAYLEINHQKITNDKLLNKIINERFLQYDYKFY